MANEMEKEADAGVTCGCTMCHMSGCSSKHGHMHHRMMRCVVKGIIFIVVFGLGFALGTFHGEERAWSGGYGMMRGYDNQGYGMMGGRGVYYYPQGYSAGPVQQTTSTPTH